MPINEILNEVKDLSDYNVDPAQMLRFVQAKRLKLVKDLENSAGGDLSNLSTGRQTNYLNALNDVSKQEIDLRKMEVEADSSAADRALAMLIVQKTIEIQSNLEGNLGHNPVNPEEALKELPQFTPIEGQMKIGDNTETYDDFNSRYIESLQGSNQGDQV